MVGFGLNEIGFTYDSFGSFVVVVVLVAVVAAAAPLRLDCTVGAVVVGVVDVAASFADFVDGTDFPSLGFDLRALYDELQFSYIHPFCLFIGFYPRKKPHKMFYVIKIGPK